MNKYEIETLRKRMAEKERKEREYFERRAKEEMEKQRKEKEDAIAKKKKEKEESESDDDFLNYDFAQADNDASTKNFQPETKIMIKTDKRRLQ